MRNTLRTMIVFMVWMLLPGVIYCQADPSAITGKMLADISLADNDSLRIEKLCRLAFFYYDYLDDSKIADSLSDVAITIAEKSHRPELLFLAYNGYIESNDPHVNYRKSLDYALNAEQLSFPGKGPELTFRNYKNLISVYLAGYEFDKALSYSYKLLSITGISDQTRLKAESYLYIGQCLEGKNQKIEAFRNYLNAESLARRVKDVKLLKECYSRLSNFYNLNKIYAKAAQYKLLERDLVTKAKPVDSAALMWVEYDLQVIDLNSNNNKLYESNMQYILDFAVRNRDKRLQNYEIALMRAHFIEANKIGRLRDLYYVKFPGELDRLAAENPGLYFRIKAFFCEEEKKPDSALYYFGKAESILQSDANIILRSKFYNRFGQYLLRNGRTDEAIEKFSKSLDLARSVFYIEYMLGAAGQLESIYAGKGDYKNAYACAVMNKVLSDSVNNMSKKDQLLIMEIDHETRQRELAATQEKEETARRHYLQYSAMMIGILSVFVILIMLGSFKVHEWIIKTLGFFSFIFLFEFIILLADHQIHEATHGEPWKILLIKIFLIAILLPLHHYIEKRVIAYLLNHRLLDLSKYSVVKWVKARKIVKNKNNNT